MATNIIHNTNNNQPITIKPGLEIIMQDGTKFIISEITGSSFKRKIILKPTNNKQVRRETTISRLKQLVNLNMITIL
jgi:hypothetical protein